ncbi:hypothetical protein BS50DRAFT_594066 [Corynespora cassiicola Philippines]|uniref:Uncharacterized protein n=1 Tax=Corynespora cassiicola Philippines TaxID=1448308 RepID=A0A2T2N4C8_CORCC|nr:hypothetical protein BS50DRAFT_594066 [Corynespora cassiicola Philippines]
MPKNTSRTMNRFECIFESLGIASDPTQSQEMSIIQTTKAPVDPDPTSNSAWDRIWESLSSLLPPATATAPLPALSTCPQTTEVVGIQTSDPSSTAIASALALTSAPDLTTASFSSLLEHTTTLPTWVLGVCAATAAAGSYCAYIYGRHSASVQSPTAAGPQVVLTSSRPLKRKADNMAGKFDFDNIPVLRATKFRPAKKIRYEVAAGSTSFISADFAPAFTPGSALFLPTGSARPRRSERRTRNQSSMNEGYLRRRAHSSRK